MIDEILQDMEMFQKMLPERQCQFCGKMFIPEEEDDYTCNVCARKFNVKCTKKDFITTNWEEKRMKKLWQKRHDKSMKNILAKCNGSKYENPKTK
jgi:methionyl-tRNA synthetase